MAKKIEAGQEWNNLSIDNPESLVIEGVQNENVVVSSETPELRESLLNLYYEDYPEELENGQDPFIFWIHETVFWGFVEAYDLILVD